MFVTDALPKGPTGKISRRFMVDAFINKTGVEAQGTGEPGGRSRGSCLIFTGLMYVGPGGYACKVPAAHCKRHQSVAGKEMAPLTPPPLAGK